ncbi:MAG: DNA-3-methyladenine glycosylase 2 family protein, partial [Acidimicrobiia bacterium]|nr:DNA-3-methyladenine glycosylase 2 family protein [Acidimicrobiia bacterium]
MIGAVRSVELHLPARLPFDDGALFGFLGWRSVRGVEAFDGETYRRTLRLPGGPATVALSADGDGVRCA